MNSTIVCQDVRPEPGNSNRCVVIAAKDDPEGERALDLTAVSNLAEAKDQLRARGIVPGGPLLHAPGPAKPNGLAAPIEIIARDQHGKEHRLLADHVDAYSLSSGSTLYYFYVSEAPRDCRWLVGHTLDIAEAATRESAVIKPGTVAGEARR